MKSFINTFPIVLFLFGVQTTFAQFSTKGNWNKIEKETLIEELNSARESFETFLSSDQVDTMILCLADKIEAEFENMDHMDGNSEDIEKMTFHCLEDMGLLSDKEVQDVLSEKGNWSDHDLNQAYENLEYTRSAMSKTIDSSQVDLLFDCIVRKLEINYVSLTAASNDGENVSRLTTECIEQLKLFNDLPESKKGNWNSADIASLNEQLEYLRTDLEASSGKENTEKVFACIRSKFENAFDNYDDINNHPEEYKAILNECYEFIK